VLQYQVPAEAFPDAPERERIELLEDAAGRSEALALYNRWAMHETGQLVRGDRVWEHLAGGPERALAGYRGPAGDLLGYALVTYRTDLPPRKRYLEVDELVLEGTDARRALYAWLGSLGDQWHQVLVRALPSHGLGDWLREPRLPDGAAPAWRLWTPAATLLMGPMFRLLDLRAAWRQRRVAEQASLAVSVQLTDAQIAENAGGWRLALDGGRATIEPGTGGDVALRMDISTLSRLFVGAQSATAALAAGRLECDRTDRLPALDAALALPEPWMFDRF
jgi:predicted acetyltransferase